ncbi:MAG: ABC transporter ATP-binding protein [Pseudomonadota bacterium]|nr:ABC transporter ATP-binding protein [Pseudomonadota bacterium]
MAEARYTIELAGICHAYDGRPVLKNLSLALPRGSFCALLGANGVGKSTLLKIIARTLQPDSGRIQHGGRLGFVPQEVHPSLPLTAMEMVLLGRASAIGLLQAPDKNDYRRARIALQRVEAGGLATRAFSSLSGGERQLVLMARALASDADVLLLDEPSAAMDWHNQALILRLLRELADNGMTIIMTTHSPQHALEFASHALLLFGAGQHLSGTPDKVMSEEALSQLYRVPVRRIQLDELPAAGTAVPVFSATPND